MPPDSGLLSPALDASPLVLAPAHEPVLPGDGMPSWAVVALNASSPHPVAEEDLLIFPKTSEPLSPGSCRLSGAGTAEAQDVVFRSEAAATKQRLSRYFLLRTHENPSRVGLGLLDVNGEARCALPSGNWFASVGSGLGRREVPVNSGEVALPLVPRGTLLVSWGEPEGALPGDVVRVARLVSAAPFPGLEFQSTPFQAQELFRPLMSRDENFGAREALVTTFLAGDAPLGIELDAGSYLVALYRSQGMSPCLARLSIPAGAEARLRCPVMRPGDVSPARDEGSLPPPLDRSPAVARFLLARRRVTQSPVRASPLQASAFPAGQVQAFSAEGVREPLSHCERMTGAMVRGELPVASTGVEMLERGAAPFLTGWRAPAAASGLEQEQAPYFVLGNGVYIQPVSYLAEPLVGMPPQHRFRFRVDIPIGNPTDVLAILVDGHESRRFVLPRGGLDGTLSLELEETITRKEDFSLSICAWGAKYNVEFLAGIPGVFPFAVTRTICVDADDDGRCSAR